MWPDLGRRDTAARDCQSGRWKKGQVSLFPSSKKQYLLGKQSIKFNNGGMLCDQPTGAHLCQFFRILSNGNLEHVVYSYPGLPPHTSSMPCNWLTHGAICYRPSGGSWIIDGLGISLSGETFKIPWEG